MSRAPGAAAHATVRELIQLPTDALGLVLYQLTLAHDIAAVAPTCHALCDAAKIAMKLRPFSSEVVMLAGHTQPVVGVAAATDGRVVTGAWDSSLKVWRDGVCERTIPARPDGGWPDVNSVAFLPGGARFVFGSDDGTARLWTLDGALERMFEADSIVLCVAALPDGVHFVVGTGGDTPYPHPNEVRLYHVDGTLVHTFRGHTAAVWAVAVTPDGQHIISGSYDKLVKVWSVATKREVATCIGHAGEVFAVAPMPNSKRFLSGSADRTVRVWHLDDTAQNTFKLHNHMVRALVALPDNQHALSGSADNSVKLFNVKDGAVLRTFRHRTNDVRSLALLPDGLRFVHGSQDNTARIAYHGLAPTKP